MIIGVTGWANHGKDTTGQYLVANYNFLRYAFADQLKDLALIINPIVGPGSLRLYAHVEEGGWEAAKKNPEVRRFLQELGTGVRKIIGADAWVEALDRQLNADGLTRKDHIVITDVRFHNEADYIHRNGGVVWRVTRRGYDNGIGTSHDSEKFVEGLPADYDFHVVTKDQLYGQINLAMDQLRRKL